MPIHMLRELEKLQKMVLSLGAMTEENLRRAVSSITNRDQKLALQAIDMDHEVDKFEVEVEEECLKVLALYQPVAHDLRFIVAILKINHDLERIGDLAVNVAQRAHKLATFPKNAHDFGIQDLAESVQRVVSNALDAFIASDAELARQIWLGDDEVDNKTGQVLTALEDEARKRPESLQGLLSLIAVAHTLERIADHATNITKDVLYMVHGEIVRHRSREFREQLPPTPPPS